MSTSNAAHARSVHSRRHRCSPDKCRSRSRSHSRSRDRGRHRSRSPRNSPLRSRDRRSERRKDGRAKAKKQKRKNEKRDKKKNKKKKKKSREKQKSAGRESDRELRELAPVSGTQLSLEIAQQQLKLNPEPVAVSVATEAEPEGIPQCQLQQQVAEPSDCPRQQQPPTLISSSGLCQVLRVSEATRRRIAEGDVDGDAPGGISVVGVGSIGTFGRPKDSAGRDAPPRTANGEGGAAASAGGLGMSTTTEPTRRHSDRRDHERPRRRRRSRTPDISKRRGREKRNRRRSDSGSDSRRSSSRSSNGSNVGLSRGCSRLRIDKDKLRRRAIENTVMGLSERCPEKLADMPCFKALGVRVSELEKICRKLTAASAEQASQQLQQAHAEGSNNNSSSSGANHPTGAGAGGASVRHPFQLRPDATHASSAGVSRFASGPSQEKELLAAFPVSSGAFHNQQGDAAAVTPAPSSTEVVGAVLQPPVLAAAVVGGVCRGDWETAKATTPAQAPPQPPQRARSPQAWVNKHQFLNAQPITDGVGHRLLQKMGWRWGQGLGRRNEGPTEPLAIGYKADRKGLASHEDRPAAPIRQFPGGKGKKKSKASSCAAAVAASLTASSAAAATASGTSLEQLHGKNPISVLMETAKRMRLPDPQFRLVHESGPPHARCFVFCARVGGTEFQPTRPSKNKKEAKAAAAAVALQQLGIVRVT